MSDLMKLIGDYAEQRVASSLLVQDRDADAAESFAIEDRLVREITDAHAAEIRQAKAEALREFADSIMSGRAVDPMSIKKQIYKRANKVEESEV